MRWLDGIISSTDMSMSKLREIGKDSEAWRAGGVAEFGHHLATEQQQRLVQLGGALKIWESGLLLSGEVTLLRQSYSKDPSKINPNARNIFHPWS